MSELEITLALFDFIKYLQHTRFAMTEEETAYFNYLRHTWNVLQGYEEPDKEDPFD